MILLLFLIFNINIISILFLLLFHKFVINIFIYKFFKLFKILNKYKS